MKRSKKLKNKLKRSKRTKGSARKKRSQDQRPSGIRKGVLLVQQIDKKTGKKKIPAMIESVIGGAHKKVKSGKNFAKRQVSQGRIVNNLVRGAIKPNPKPNPKPHVGKKAPAKNNTGKNTSQGIYKDKNRSDRKRGVNGTGKNEGKVNNKKSQGIARNKRIQEGKSLSKRYLRKS